MITPKEYFSMIKTVNADSFPEKLQKGYEFTEEVTEYHTTWKYYKSDKDIKRAVDSYLKELSVFLEKSPPPKMNLEMQAREAAKKLIEGYVRRGDTVEQLKAGQTGAHGGGFSAMIKGNKIHVDEVKGKKVNYSFPLQSIYNEIKDETGGDKIKPTQHEIPKPSKSMKQSKPIKKEPVKKEIHAKQVERVDDEVRLIKRYALMNGKKKTDGQILNFLNAVQKAILEKRIRKSSPYAKEIEYIQTNLAKLYNRMDDKVEIKIDRGVLEKFLSIGGSEKVRPSVTYLKRYIGMQGKKLTKEKVQRLITMMQNAARKQKITKDDPYVERLQKAFGSLAAFVKNAKKNDMLEIHPAVLNGINEALEGCGCYEEEHLDGVDDEGFTEPEPVQAPRIMNSLDFAEMEFDTLGFTGKWLDLIGDPCEGFTAMVFGKPKMGKSYLCVDMAGYLARHHGNTLYVAREEKLDKTLQDKLSDKNVKHPCLFVSDHLPGDLSTYQYVILDSVNKLGLTPQDLERLKAENPGKSFIYIFQTTKQGYFRGSNQFQHDVDVVIEVPELGKAVQFGRFNQGGEIEIFGDSNND